MLLTKENINDVYNQITKQEIKITPSSPAYEPTRNQYLVYEDGSKFSLYIGNKEKRSLCYSGIDSLHVTYQMYYKDGINEKPKLCWEYSLPIAFFKDDGTVNYVDELLNTDTQIIFDKFPSREVDLSTDVKITIKGTVLGPIVTTARTYKEDLAPYKEALVTYHETEIWYDNGDVLQRVNRFYQPAGTYIVVNNKELPTNYRFAREVSSNVYDEIIRNLDYDFGGLYD